MAQELTKKNQEIRKLFEKDVKEAMQREREANERTMPRHRKHCVQKRQNWKCCISSICLSWTKMTRPKSRLLVIKTEFRNLKWN